MEVKIAMPPIGKSTSRTQQQQQGECRNVSTATARCDQVIDCAGCHKLIRERYMLKAVDQLWHEDCLKCSCCDCRLGEVGSTLFTKANLILCKRDYLRLFGNTGYCSACNKMIPAFEMVMRAKTNVYHLECFACQQCNHRFCVGDKFYLCNDKILCEYDYEERLVFASMSYNYNSIAHIKKQTNNLHTSKQQRHANNNNGQQVAQLQQQQQQQQHPHDANSGTNSMNSSMLLPNVGGAPSLTSQSDDTSSGYGSPESPMFDRK